MTQRSCLKTFHRPIIASLSLFSLTLGAFSADAATHHKVRHHAVSRHHHTVAHHRRHTTKRHGHVIQCVAFAKRDSDIMIHGNAVDWWAKARGVYARGHAPEAGAVLNFRGTRRMPLGHVAVVKEVVDSRTIVIDHSHWGVRGISRNVQVMDVSPNNDWSAVRVALRGTDGFGSIYPTYGFIYARSPDGVMMADSNAKSGNDKTDSMNALRHPMSSTEVAEAPMDAMPLEGSLLDAPNRSIR